MPPAKVSLASGIIPTWPTWLKRVERAPPSVLGWICGGGRLSLRLTSAKFAVCLYSANHGRSSRLSG